ncbi:SpoIIE family protein phosphatase [Streptomyces sp. Isolate_219]|uniref:SpoIIE family protein phosphatase n=1 Tax=Streptomyces sp. Isolate_219 TaxID=2950110 RepID=UPI0021C8EFAF|nr:SpoIIE family protein phosphatase [Streptomyces sp. Isolate_219]MCR8573822.1 SpoIIE family protein phosphatase [Streptomyces sp. Isolate_219]
MGTAGPFGPAGAQPPPGEPQRSGLLDLLSVAAVLLDAEGRIVLWSPQAEKLFGYTAQEALGRYAGRLLVHEQQLDLVIRLFTEVMATGESWAGAFPVRHKDGSTRLVEFRNMRLLDDRGDFYALGIATDEEILRQVERDVALSTRLVSQSPIGLAVLDTELRYLAVNPALERMNGVPAEDHLGRSVREVLPFLETDAIEAALRQVLESGTPLVDEHTVGRTPADPDHDHAWSVSYYRLEDPGGRVLGVAGLAVDVTDRHRAATEAARARRRLAMIADGSARIGTTLEVEQTARELADVAVPDLADVAAVDILDSVLEGRPPQTSGARHALFRALAVKAAYPTEAVRAADPPGHLASYGADRLATRCVRTARPILIPHVEERDLARIARDPEAAALLARAGIHTYLTMPLIARGEVLGALGLTRARNPLPFDEDDLALAAELADRAAVCIDNARLYQSQRNAALTLQRSLLPAHPPHQKGLEIATRYQPAGTTSEVGGDWFDVIPLRADKTALVVGDVMGSGIDAATTMGRLRTATSTLADLDIPPTEVLQHIDKITAGLDQYATCAYAVYDPHHAVCHIAVAGHLPPVLMRTGRPPELLDLPIGVPLGVGGVPFEEATFAVRPGDQLVLYTDGLVETRHDAIDERLALLLHLLDSPDRSLEDTCDRLLDALRDPDDPDDVAVLIARARHQGGAT